MPADAEHDARQPYVERLIARLEVAERGNRDLDMDIAKALGFRPIATIRGVQIHNPAQPAGASWDLPFYTTSIDAALTLLPEGWWLQHLGHNLAGWGARIETQGISLPASTHLPRSTTPALAICIPALRARTSVPLSPAAGREDERKNTDEQ